jgi:hypothetical protein
MNISKGVADLHPEDRGANLSKSNMTEHPTGLEVILDKIRLQYRIWDV